MKKIKFAWISKGRNQFCFITFSHTTIPVLRTIQTSKGLPLTLKTWPSLFVFVMQTYQQDISLSPLTKKGNMKMDNVTTISFSMYQVHCCIKTEQKLSLSASVYVSVSVQESSLHKTFCFWEKKKKKLNSFNHSPQLIMRMLGWYMTSGNILLALLLVSCSVMSDSL